MAFPALLQNQSAAVLLGALAQAENQRAELLIRRVPADSDVQVLTGRIREIEAQLQGVAGSYLQSLSNQVQSREGEVARFGSQLDVLPVKEVELARRQRNADVLKDLWRLVQTRLKEAQITGTAADPGVRVVDRAVPAVEPASPRLPITLGVAATLGVLAGVAAALGRDLRDRHGPLPRGRRRRPRACRCWC